MEDEFTFRLRPVGIKNPDSAAASKKLSAKTA